MQCSGSMVAHIYLLKSLLLVYLFANLCHLSGANSNFVNNCGNHRQVHGPFHTNATYGIISNYENGTFSCEWLIATGQSSQVGFIINLQIISNDLDCHSDTLYIFDGHSYESPLISTVSGQSLHSRQVTASSGYMLMLHYWQVDSIPSKFTAEFSITQCPLNCSSHGRCVNSYCHCDPFWTGQACQIDSCPGNCSLSGKCVMPPPANQSYLNEHLDYRCECMSDYIGQSCDVIRTDSASQKHWLHWKVLFTNSNYFPSRASHSSVYCPVTDTIYTYGGRGHEIIYRDLLAFSITNNSWQNLTCKNDCQSDPPSLWGHTLNVFNSTLVLFGGILSNGILSNQLWIYQLVSHKWARVSIDEAAFVPSIAFHTSTLVDYSFLHIIGGRLQDGRHSSNVYRVNLMQPDKTFQLVNPINDKPFSRQLAGHTAAYYKPLNSIIIFGGVSLIGDRSSRLSNDIHLFHVNKRVWSTLQFFDERDFHVPDKRAFHSMLLLDHYLLVFGGFAQANVKNGTWQRNCQDNRLYMYSLICNKWIDFDYFVSSLSSTITSSHFPLGGLVSHTLVARRNLLFVFGGYSGEVHSEIFVYSLPKVLSNAFQYELCSQLKSRSSCNLNPLCFWCPSGHVLNHLSGNYCAHHEHKCSVQVQLHSCPGLCSRLSNCYACLAFNSLDSELSEEESSYAVPQSPHSCLWNSLDFRCFHSNISNSVHFSHFLSNENQCFEHNLESGIAFLKYLYPQNLSTPDQLVFLRQIDFNTSFREGLVRNLVPNNPNLKKPDNSSLVNIGRIMGYIHPFGLQPYHENLVRLFLNSTSAQASFVMNGLTRPVVSINSSKPIYRSYIDLPVNFSSDSLLDDNFLVDLIIKFPIRTVWKELDYERIELSASGHTGTKALFHSNLTPYRNVHQCGEAISCTACLSNLACAWCASAGRCTPRSDLSLCHSDPTSDEALPIVDAEQCVLCSDYLRCDQCVQNELCEWLAGDQVCLRRGRFHNSIRNMSACSTACHLRSSCSSCLDPSGFCVWCYSLGQCVSASTYHSSPPFYFCQTFDSQLFSHNAFFLNKRFLAPYKVEQSQVMCDKCLRHATCLACQNDPSCEWCYLQSDSSQGFCALSNDANSSRCSLSMDFGSMVDHPRLEASLFVPSKQSCPLVNECVLGHHNCHQDSFCIDTEQSFKCACRPGFTGDGLVCTRTCTSLCGNGYCSEFPDFRCICDLGWTGHDCMLDCGCHNHSTCQTKVGTCDHCENNTQGKHCQLCAVGSYGNATTSEGCKVCECNGHGDELLGVCQSTTGLCYCQEYTEGSHCERCISGYYGNPRNGGHCFMECQHRKLVSQQDSGFFGSYIRDIHFSKRTSVADTNHQWTTSHLNCLWIFTSHGPLHRFDSFAAYYSTLDTQSKFLPLGVTIFKSAQLNCSSSQVLVYDGIPRFLSASNLTKATKLATLCGQQAQYDTSLVAVSGFMTVLYNSNNLSQGFNASFSKLVAPDTILFDWPLYSESPVEENHTSSQDDQNRLFSEQTLWEERSHGKIFSSPWPKQSHTQLQIGELLIFVGGHEHSDGLAVSLFNLTSKSWQQVKGDDNPTPSNRILHASTLSEQTIFLYGGLSESSNQVMQDFWSCIIPNSTSELIVAWKPIDPQNNKIIPPLVGHTLTALQVHSKSALLLVGGYSPSDGFLDQQYIYWLDSNQWQLLPTRGAAPLGVFAHSSIYHRTLRSLYLFGGVDFKDSHKLTSSSTLYVLSLSNLVWRRMQPNNVVQPNLPTTRFMHSAASTEDYMIILGGRNTLSNEIMHNSILVYHYRCSNWLTLNLSPSFFLQNVNPHFSSHVLSMSASDQLLYIYWSKQRTGRVGTSSSLHSIPMPVDLCALHSSNQDTCLQVRGCSFCKQPNHTHQSNICFDNQQVNWPCKDALMSTSSPQGDKCSVEQQSCTDYSTCVDCTTSNLADTNHMESCQWCTDCRQKEGRCIALNETCELFELNGTANQGPLCANLSIEDISQCPLQRCLATDCDKCLKYSQPGSHKLACAWAKQTSKFVHVGPGPKANPISDWLCVDSTIVENSSSSSHMEMVPSLSCPARCHRHKTCSLCVESTTSKESDTGECVWSEQMQQCMSATLALLMCEHSRCGQLVHRESNLQCPAPCETHSKASDCLAAPNCGWCAINGFKVDGMGLCQRGGLFGPVDELCRSDNFHLLMLLKQMPFFEPLVNFSTEWHYLYSPQENECLNNHHTCEPASQQCVDREVGFVCTCKPGYKLVESTCKPICQQGCVYGVCVQPDICNCNFGIIGHDCSLECKCHGHSTCPSANRLHECVQCHNHTQGDHCEQCKENFVGDPRNSGVCQSCFDYCNTHSNQCSTASGFNSSINTNETFWHQSANKESEGFKSGALCEDCKNNTEGERCDRCKLGFFKRSDDIRDGCHECMCNQHGSICNPFNGENCNCQNNTENDRQCNYLNTRDYTNYINKTYFFKSTQVRTTYSLPCWMLQCTKCKDYFYGIPTYGHQCYRHMYIDKEYCFDPVSQEDCIHKALLQGRTVFFGIQPRYMNVDIKLVVYILTGEVDLYFCSKDDLFVVKVNQSNGVHHTFIDSTYIQSKYNDKQPGIRLRSVRDTISQEEKNQNSSWLSVDEEGVHQFEHTLKSPFRLHEHKLTGVQPHYYTVHSLNEIVIFRKVRHRLEVTIPYRWHELRTTRFYFMLRGNGIQTEQNESSTTSTGYVLFRQDQCRIDLFVFFSVFFSCFFLFLCVSVLVWRVKQVFDHRRAQHIHEIELEHMASRPFASIFLLFDSPEEHPFRKVAGQSMSVPCTPAKRISLFRQLTLGFKESPKIHPESTQPTVKVPDKGLDKSIKPVSIEPTSDGLASILTTLVQLPGGNLVPNRLSAASSLVSLKNAPHLMQQINYVK